MGRSRKTASLNHSVGGRGKPDDLFCPPLASARPSRSRAGDIWGRRVSLWQSAPAIFRNSDGNPGIMRHVGSFKEKRGRRVFPRVPPRSARGAASRNGVSQGGVGSALPRRISHGFLNLRELTDECRLVFFETWMVSSRQEGWSDRRPRTARANRSRRYPARYARG